MFNVFFLSQCLLKYFANEMRSHSHSVRRDLPNPMCTVFPTVTRLVCMPLLYLKSNVYLPYKISASLEVFDTTIQKPAGCVIELPFL